VHDVVGERCVEDRGGVELLSGNRGTDDGEDAGPDDRADAERGKRPRTESLLKPVLRFLGIGDQLVDGLAGKDLRSQDDAPGSTYLLFLD